MALVYVHDRSPVEGGRRLSAAELAREPRDMGIVAWYDGWGQGAGLARGKCGDYLRRLTADEAREWREGFREGARERACHRRHGFGPCVCGEGAA
jgi:hypothetical protein